MHHAQPIGAEQRPFCRQFGQQIRIRATPQDVLFQIQDQVLGRTARQQLIMQGTSRAMLRQLQDRDRLKLRQPIGLCRGAAVAGEQEGHFAMLQAQGEHAVIQPRLTIGRDIRVQDIQTDAIAKTQRMTRSQGHHFLLCQRLAQFPQGDVFDRPSVGGDQTDIITAQQSGQCRDIPYIRLAEQEQLDATVVKRHPITDLREQAFGMTTAVDEHLRAAGSLNEDAVAVAYIQKPDVQMAIWPGPPAHCQQDQQQACHQQSKPQEPPLAEPVEPSLPAARLRGRDEGDARQGHKP